jgi:hypothetical protein
VTPAQRFAEVVAELAGHGVAVAKVFGVPGLLAGGRAFACLTPEGLACRLGSGSPAHRAGRAVAGARPFDPRGRGHPLPDWVVVPFSAQQDWGRYAAAAHLQAHERDLPGGAHPGQAPPGPGVSPAERAEERVDPTASDPTGGP